MPSRVATGKKRGPRGRTRTVQQRNAVQRHREHMRKQGMRLLQLWVPDTDAPGFAEECRRQSLRVSRSRAPDEQALNGELEAWAGEIDRQLGKP